MHHTRVYDVILEIGMRRRTLRQSFSAVGSNGIRIITDATLEISADDVIADKHRYAVIYASVYM
jgi:hypothetical protein